MSSIYSRIRSHMDDQDSRHRRIFSGFLWVSMFVVLSRLAGAAKEVAIAWRYGVSETVDAYVFILSLITWPISVWFSVLTAVLVPLVAYLRENAAAELPRFRGELLGFAVLLGLGLGVAGGFGLWVLLDRGWARLGSAALSEALSMSGPLSLLLPMGCIVSVFAAWTMAAGRHRNTLFEGIPALVILFVLLLPRGWVPEPLVWATVMGVALHIIGLAWSLQGCGELSRPSIAFESPAWRGFWSGVGIMSVGQFLSSSTVVVDQFFAAELGRGAIATLNYANRLLALLLGVGAMAISRATLPVFSEAHANPKLNHKGLVLQWSRWMMLAGLVVAFSSMALAPWAVELLFERGAFTHDDTQAVAALLRYGLLQVPFYCAGLVLVSALASAKRYSIIALSGGLNILFKLVLAYPLVEWLGLDGLVLSTVGMYALAVGFLYFATQRSFRTVA